MKKITLKQAKSLLKLNKPVYVLIGDAYHQIEKVDFENVDFDHKAVEIFIWTVLGIKTKSFKLLTTQETYGLFCATFDEHNKSFAF